MDEEGDAAVEIDRQRLGVVERSTEHRVVDRIIGGDQGVTEGGETGDRIDESSGRLAGSLRDEGRRQVEGEALGGLVGIVDIEEEADGITSRCGEAR